MKNRLLFIIIGLTFASLVAATSLRSGSEAEAVLEVSEPPVFNSDSLQEIQERILYDFPLSEIELKEQLRVQMGQVSDAQLRQWEQSGLLEMQMIGGEKRYFKNAVPNLQRMLAFQKKQKEAFELVQPGLSALDSFCLQHTARVIDLSGDDFAPVLPHNIVINYTLSVKPNVEPEGTVLRCWLPAPREGISRQRNFRLLSSDPENGVLAPNSNLQRTYYLERKTIADQPTVFSVRYAIQTSAQYFGIQPQDAMPYDTTSAIYMHYTQEQLPHVVFSPKIKQLAARIVGDEKNSLRKVEEIYQWINDSIPWASALEYCTMPCIPEYVLKNGHGDCGMQTFLFMSLARSQGIPVKWQSGFMLHPGEVNLHDWCEVYYEGVGWVPLDQSFGLQKTDNKKIREFYVHGIDAYRLIVNDDFGQELFPPKKYLRSEPYDFQRGEVEWEGGNLYFDNWTWDIDVEYENGIE